MGSRFLIGGNDNLEVLQDGTFDASLNSLTIPSRTLNLPAVFDSGLLTERLLTPDDLNFTVLTNPFRGTLQVDDLETVTTFSLNGEIQKIDNFEASTSGNTNIEGTVNVDIVKTAEIYDPSDSSSLQFSNTSIGVLASNFNLNNNNITEVNDIQANKFIVRGGTDIQYLLADGSLLTASANSGNSNFYLYKSIDNATTPPISSGDVVYNNVVQSLATVIYISHLTRDNVDIEVFFQNISSLNDLYIQDQNSSLNYIRYNITGNPTLVPNAYILIPVIVNDSSGTGGNSFGPNHNILISIFTNSIETDIRISNLEEKTQNQTAVSNLTTFSGDISTSSQASINTILGYVSNYNWTLIGGASVSQSGSSISFTHKAIASYVITNKSYVIRNIRTYITCVLPDLTGLPNAAFPENYVRIGSQETFGITIFRLGGILYLNFVYFSGYNPINYPWVAGDVLKITCDGTNIYYTLSGSSNVNYTKSYDVGYPDYSQFICGFDIGNPISSTNLTFEVSKFQITQQALECYDIIPTTNNTYDLGSTLKTFKDIYVSGLVGGYNIVTINTNTTSAQTTANNALPKSGGTMTGIINSLNILPVITNTNSIGSQTFPFLNSEATSVNTKSLVIWNSARTFANVINALPSSTFTMTLPPAQGALNSILRNSGGGALTWVSASSTLTQQYASAEMLSSIIFPTILTTISGFVTMGNSNLLTISTTGITINTIGIYSISLSAEINLMDPNTVVELQINRGATLFKLFNVIYSQNSALGGAMCPSYKIFYNKITAGAELISILFRRLSAADTDVILNRAYLSIRSIQ